MHGGSAAHSKQIRVSFSTRHGLTQVKIRTACPHNAHCRLAAERRPVSLNRSRTVCPSVRVGTDGGSRTGFCCCRAETRCRAPYQLRESEGDFLKSFHRFHMDVRQGELRLMASSVLVLGQPVASGATREAHETWAALIAPSTTSDGSVASSPVWQLGRALLHDDSHTMLITETRCSRPSAARAWSWSLDATLFCLDRIPGSR